MLEAACNGRGTCGKCRVRLLQAKTPVTDDERRFLSAEETGQGYRLACRVQIYGDMKVQVPDSGYAQIQVPDSGDMQKQAPDDGSARMQVPDSSDTCKQEPDGGQNSLRESTEYCIAADLGSTTLAAVLLDASGKSVAQASSVNSQRAYGADVISRIQASNEGKQKQLQECICRDMEQLFGTLFKALDGSGRVTRIAIAANTVMLYLLCGYSCEKLGQAPFEPVSLELESLDYAQLFAGPAPLLGCRVYLLPGMSAFLGADITAGLYSSGFWQMPEGETAFFADLGTNGELVYGSRDGFVSASAPAGPAFEGGSLSCGMPGMPGAVSNVSYLYHRVRVQTVGQKKPCGICGTGALEAVSALLKEGLLNAEGLLAPELSASGMLLAKREDGTAIRLTQADIREIQMAKAAVRAGIEILQRKYREISGRPVSEGPQRVYLAGGFGYYLSAQTAAAIGLFPPEWTDRVISCGNTSLKGAVAFLTDPACAGELERIRARGRNIWLENEPDFPDIYVQNMRFSDM